MVQQLLALVQQRLAFVARSVKNPLQGKTKHRDSNLISDWPVKALALSSNGSSLYTGSRCYEMPGMSGNGFVWPGKPSVSGPPGLFISNSPVKALSLNSNGSSRLDSRYREMPAIIDGHESREAAEADHTLQTKASRKQLLRRQGKRLRPLRLLMKLLNGRNGRPLRFLMKLPLHLLSIIGNLPALSALKKPLSLFVDQDEMKSEEEDAERAEKGEGQESTEKIIPPTRDELAIPSVAALSSAGVKFVATDGDLTTIQFDEKTATIYLPKVRLDANTEVILRNLVAFESSAAPGALVFTRYTDFINGMIDSEEDVRLLKESGIITNHLRNDGEVASLWNSMGKCVPLTKVAYLDKVIKDINNHYNRKWNVAVVEFLNERVFGSWKFLSLVAAAILLAVTCLQAFCSVYNCKKWFNQTGP